MRVSVKWIREMVSLDEHSDTEIGDRLTLTGLEVEAVEDMAAGIKDIVVGRVVDKAPHPNADRLSVCKVDTGTDTVQVVCGAKNVEADTLIAFAPVGAVLPDGMEIKQAKIRDVESFGMICSERELALSQEHAGIMILEPSDDFRPGTPLAEALGRNDTVLEIGVTPNRPDALSHIGIAREVAVALDARRKVSAPTCAERGGPIDSFAHVTIKDPEGCPRYGCRVIEDVAVGPSPAWLVSRLASCGVRSINNIVDVTNLVMMERGIPLHGFDLDRIGKERERAEIIVRNAEAGEKLTTLDDKERDLDVGDLVIADPHGPIALAGVMGGASTEVHTKTTRVLLECAHFAPSRVRRTARRLGLHSEASHRFERGADPNGVRQSLDRAASLIAELGEGRVARGTIDVYPRKLKPAEVSLRPEKVAELLGLSPRDVDEATCSKLLLGIGLEVSGREGRALRFRIPTFRPDLVREVDLIEEILRLIGYDSVPATLPARSGEAQGVFDSRRQRVTNVASSVLRGAGFLEAVNLAFTGPTDAQWFAPADAEPIVVKNPLGEETSLMRPSLLPALLKNVATNQRRGAEEVRLYEQGSVFLRKNAAGAAPRPQDEDGPLGGDAFAAEQARIAGVLTGPVGRAGFDRKRNDADFYDLKGTLEDMFDALGLEAGFVANNLRFHAPDNDEALPFYHPRARAEVRFVKAGEAPRWVGHLGEVHPDVADAYETKGPVFGFELSLEALASAVPLTARARPLPKYPAVRRDLAFVIDDDVPTHDFCADLTSVDEVRALLEDVEIFDVFRGEQLAAGKKSIAIGFVLRAADRTLTDAEINTVATTLIQRAESAFGAEVRA